MRLLFILLFTFIFITGLSYLLGAFIATSFNISLWSSQLRELTVLLYVCFGLPIIGVCTGLINEHSQA